MLSYNYRKEIGDNKKCSILNYMKRTEGLNYGISLKIFVQNPRQIKISAYNINKIMLYIELLQNNGTRLPDNITKHIDDGIWELRPGNNRIFYFFFQNNTFILLHHFRKKTQKTPRMEIEKAKSERSDYLSRKE